MAENVDFRFFLWTRPIETTATNISENNKFRIEQINSLEVWHYLQKAVISMKSLYIFYRETNTNLVWGASVKLRGY